MTTASQPEGKDKGGRPPMPLPERQERFQRFLDRVEAGDSLREALAASGQGWGYISRWIADERHTMPDGLTFGAHYARARHMNAYVWEDRVTEYANAANPEWVQVSRLQVDSAKWRAAMANRDFRDKGSSDVTVNVSLGALHLDALRKVSASAKVIPHTEIADAEVLSLPRDSEQPSVPIRGEEGP